MTYKESDFCDRLRDVSRNMERKCERMAEEMQEMEECRKAFDMVSEIVAENDRLKAENEDLRARLQEREMQLNEMSKLSAGVAKKASHEELIKAIRTFINISKRKSLDKRVHVKIIVMELVDAANITLPEDLRDALAHLDDEQPETPAPTIVNVNAGGINVQQANAVSK